MNDKLLGSPNLLINGSEFDHVNYLKFHQIRLRKTIQKIKDTKSRKVVEVGSQFSNPLRLKSPTSAYRSEMYERHTFLYTKSVLEDLVSLCGFRILESGYWDVYERQGLSKFYGFLSMIPVPYLQAKFCKTIYIVAEEENSIDSLPKTLLAYRESHSWEFISR